MMKTESLSTARRHSQNERSPPQQECFFLEGILQFLRDMKTVAITQVLAHEN